jgi:NADH-quinone oxidoreductase subunit N
MSSAIDFILIFVSLELVTISFYVLVAYMRRNASSLEAGVKYLILSALSTGFTIYGITWIYEHEHEHDSKPAWRAAVPRSRHTNR